MISDIARPLLLLMLPIFGSTFSVASLAGDVTVEVKGNEVSPDRLVFKAGDTIIFVQKSHDNPEVTIIVENSAQVQASGELARGGTWEYKFVDAGSYDYFVSETPSVRGRAIVFDARGANADLRQESVSYSIGYDFGLRLSKNLKNLNLALFHAGVDHAYQGVSPKLSANEMDFILSEYGREVVRAEQQKHARLVKRNQESASRFLQSNVQRDGIVALPSGLQYEVLKRGQGNRPKTDSIVRVHYRATFLNGAEFDDTFDTEPATFAFTKSIIAGFYEGLSLMREGSRWRLFIPPGLAYGARGQAGNKTGLKVVEPNAMLIFEVELLSVE